MLIAHRIGSTSHTLKQFARRRAMGNTTTIARSQAAAAGAAAAGGAAAAAGGAPAAPAASTHPQQDERHAAGAPLPWRLPPSQSATSVRLAVLGDLHGDFSLHEDAAALQWLQPDLVAIVGDLTNEGPALVEQIARLPLPKAVILGNHDAWYSSRQMKSKPFKPAAGPEGQPPVSLADALRGGGGGQLTAEQLAQQHPEVAAALQRLPGGASNAVVRQLELLGPSHVGYAGLQVPGKQVSIVGARPFSHGGDKFFHVVGLTSTLWPGVNDFAASAERIQRAARAEVERGARAVVLMGHNAALGLGGAPYDVAGVDWLAAGGDHGDGDLRLALDALHHQGVHVPLVLCGHMHHRLKDGSYRRMAHVDAATGCVTLNAAVVPRVRRAPAPAGLAAGGGGPPPQRHATDRHFLLVELEGGLVVHAQHAWVRVAAEALSPADSEEALGVCECSLARQVDVLTAQSGERGRNVRLWDAQHERWVEVFVPRAATSAAAAQEELAAMQL